MSEADPVASASEPFGWPLKIYGVIVALLLLLFLAARRSDLLAGQPSNLDLLISAALIGLLLAPLFREVTLGGVTLKHRIQQTVKAEVGKAQADALKLAASMDLLRMPIWESENSSVPTAWSQQKLDLFMTKATEFEKLWRESPEVDRVHFGLMLRDLYWEWLAAARHHHASSMPYQDVWRHVERGFSMLAGVPHKPTR